MFLSANPYAINLLEEHIDKIDWNELSYNREAIQLLETHEGNIQRDHAQYGCCYHLG